MTKTVEREKLKDNNKFSFKKLWVLVMFQLREKLDLGWIKQKKDLIRKIVFTVLKFVAVMFGTFGACFLLSSTFGLVKTADIINVYLVFFAVYALVNLINITLGMIKSLYYAEDNKLLVTFPVGSSSLFLSKLMVFLLAELRRSVDILLPVTLGAVLCGVANGLVDPVCLFYCMIVLIIVVGIMVVLGALLSIPTSYLLILFNKVPILELIGFVIIMAGIIVGVVTLINLVPENINLLNEWPEFNNNIQAVISTLSRTLVPITFVIEIIFGSPSYNNQTNSHGFSFGWDTIGSTGILIGVLAVLSVIVFFAIRPFYFYMMSKSFEFDKVPVDVQKSNVVHKKYITFIDKEFKITFRNVEISGSYLIVYIIVPILLLLIDAMFSAINKRLEGYIMTYAFNVLLMTIPYLASNSMIATLYSKEGRAAYIKKTKPVSPLIPLTSKLVFNLALSIPSIIACGVVFYNFASASGIKAVHAVLLAFSVLFIQYAHIFFSATLDIMNPQNERYATQGEDFTNPNERTATIVAFITSFVVAFITFFLLKDSYYHNGESFDAAFIKIFCLSLLGLASTFTLFVLKIKAYYFEK